MVDEVIIKNLTTNVTLVLNRTTSSFLLDDKSPDWGTVNATDVTYPNLASKIGVGIIRTSMNAVRQISFTGWIFNDANGTIEDKKEILNTFCNPFDSLRIESNGYTIEGHTSQPIVYSSDDSINNDCICKFIIYVTCPFPLFSKSAEGTDDLSELEETFTFPWVIPESGFVFGIRTKQSSITINNLGTVATGFVMEVKTSGTIKGLSFTVGNQTLAVKPNYIFTSGKRIRISTVAGQIGIWLKTGNGEYEKAFNILDLDSDWIQLPIGLSTIQMSCSEGSLSTVDASVSVKYLYYAMEEQ